MFKNIKFIPYNKTPECPRCGSNITGEIVNVNDANYQLYSHLKKGQLCYPTHYKGYLNCKCDTCNFEWNGNIQTTLASINQIKAFKEEKGITEDLIKYYKNYDDNHIKEIKKSNKINKFQKLKQSVYNYIERTRPW